MLHKNKAKEKYVLICAGKSYKIIFFTISDTSTFIYAVCFYKRTDTFNYRLFVELLEKYPKNYFKTLEMENTY